MGAGQLFDLPVQPLDHLARVAVEARLALHVAEKPVDATAQRVDLRQGARFLIAQGVPLQDQPLQDGRGNRLFLALRRQGILSASRAFPAPRDAASAWPWAISRSRKAPSAADRASSASRQRRQSSIPSDFRNSSEISR